MLTVIMIGILYLIGVLSSVVIMAYFNRKFFSLEYRAPAGAVISFALVWPIGLPSFFMFSILLKLENSNFKKFLKKFIEGE